VGLRAREQLLLTLISIFKDYPDMFSPAVHTCDEFMWAFATVSHRSLCFCHSFRALLSKR